MSYIASAPAPGAGPPLDAQPCSDRPAADAVARTCRNSLLSIIVPSWSKAGPDRGQKKGRRGAAGPTRRSPVDRRLGIHQVGDQVLDLLLGQRPRGAEARHRRARREGLRVVDPLVGVLLRLGGVTAHLAEVAQARAERAERGLLRRQLVAVVAAAAAGNP